MTIIMFDAVDISVLPAGASAYAGYVNGRWATYPALRARFPGASILSIAVSADADADCLDIEAGDAIPDQVPGWVIRQHRRGILRPCLYASVSAVPGILVLLSRAGISRGSVRLWSAHYGQGQHICGPGTCRQVSIAMDGTQWTDNARGLNLDQSLLAPDFFGEAAASIIYLTAAQTEAIMNVLPVLREGMSDTQLPHQYVRRVQLILSGVYKLGTGTIDGVYGVKTAAAVKVFQEQYKLTADSICGPLTWGKIIGG